MKASLQSTSPSALAPADLSTLDNASSAENIGVLPQLADHSILSLPEKLERPRSAIERFKSLVENIEVPHLPGIICYTTAFLLVAANIDVHPDFGTETTRPDASSDQKSLPLKQSLPQSTSPDIREDLQKQRLRVLEQLLVGTEATTSQ